MEEHGSAVRENRPHTPTFGRCSRLQSQRHQSSLFLDLFASGGQALWHTEFRGGITFSRHCCFQTGHRPFAGNEDAGFLSDRRTHTGEHPRKERYSTHCFEQSSPSVGELPRSLLLFFLLFRTYHTCWPSLAKNNEFY